MSAAKPFQPKFGPNGAVLNASTMTDELRAEYEREASVKQSILRTLPFPVLLLAMIGIQLIFKPPFEPVWIGFLAAFIGSRWLPQTATRQRNR
jgi:hypothetical protein